MAAGETAAAAEAVRTGASFGRCVRTTHTPSETNRMLSRINPKAMDVLTLVSDVENVGGSLFAVFEEPAPIENDAYDGYEGDAALETSRSLPRDGRMPVMAGSGYDRHNAQSANQRRSPNEGEQDSVDGETSQDLATALNAPSRQSLSHRSVAAVTPKPAVPALEAPKTSTIKPSGGLPGLLSSIFRRLPGGHHTEAPPALPTEGETSSPRMAVLEMPGQAPLPVATRSRSSQSLPDETPTEGSDSDESSSDGRSTSGSRQNAPAGNGGRSAPSSRRNTSVHRYEPPSVEAAAPNAVIRYAELPADDDDDSDAVMVEAESESPATNRSPRSGNNRNRRRPRRPGGGTGGGAGGGGRRPPSGPSA